MTPIVFFNVGWMNQYSGLSAGDQIHGGGSWVADHGMGGEIYNFAPTRGRYLGYVKVRGTLNIDRLGAQPGEDHVDGVTVAWVAPHPDRGLCLQGWYANARVFREPQSPLAKSKRRVGKDYLAEYLATARVGDSVLLDPDLRTLRIPRNRKGAMGQANVWFADSPVGKRTAATVINFIAKHSGHMARVPVRGRSLDPARRALIEKAAIDLARVYYLNQHFVVRDVQRDNAGWDLEASRGGEKFLIEVKGLSGHDVVAELTPNEYRAMLKHSAQFRLCIVTNALDTKRAQLRRFAFLRGIGWIDQDNSMLEIDERIGARVSLGAG